MTVSVSEWLKQTYASITESPKQGLVESGYYVGAGVLLSITSRRPFGTNIFDRDWDMLIILDACRTDALQQVIQSRNVPIVHSDSILSVGSTSSEWMAKTFTREYLSSIEQTVYATANPYTEEVFDNRNFPPHSKKTPPFKSVPFASTSYDVVNRSDFKRIDDVWQYGTDEQLGTVPPRVMTDRTIEIGRDQNPNRTVVHYMQPHAPYLADSNEFPGDVLVQCQSGEVSRDRVWEAYLANLELVLDHVEILLRNFDADKVVITADHGEAFGEWGSYAHRAAFPHPCVKRVPWISTSATDHGQYEPEVGVREQHDSDNMKKRLKDLGYFS